MTKSRVEERKGMNIVRTILEAVEKVAVVFSGVGERHGATLAGHDISRTMGRLRSNILSILPASPTSLRMFSRGLKRSTISRSNSVLAR